MARARARAKERGREGERDGESEGEGEGKGELWVVLSFFDFMDGWLWDEQRRSYDFAETLHRFIWKSCDVIISNWKKSDLVRILVQKPNR